MVHVRSLVFGLAISAAGPALACSCFGPTTFCTTLDPPYANPEWWIPESVVLGVKLSDVQYGMDVKVLEVFAGPLQIDDTVRVWGDCGALCRHYTGTWAVGDTVVWGFRITDLSGNTICGTNYEQPADRMISICGVYYLDYSNGVVSGPITAETVETMPIEQLDDLVSTCLTMGVEQPVSDDALKVAVGPEGVRIVHPSPECRQLVVIDAAGKVLVDRPWDGGSMLLPPLATGVHVIQVRVGDRLVRRKVLVP